MKLGQLRSAICASENAKKEKSMSLSSLVGIIGFPFRRWPRRRAAKRPAKIMPRPRARIFEVQPLRIGNSESFLYRVVNLQSGVVLKRTKNFALAEITCEQCNRDIDIQHNLKRAHANGDSIAAHVRKTFTHVPFVQ